MSEHGIPYLAVGIFVLLAGFFVGLFHPSTFPNIVVIVGVVYSAFMFLFFRDPKRRILPEPRAVISPADGKVIKVEELEDEFVGRCNRVRIFMSIIDVHVVRMPVGGVVKKVVWYPGKFYLAFKKKAAESNARASLNISSPLGNIKLHLIAGFLARKIVCYPSGNDKWDAGQKIGFIKFGSAVDIFIPREFALEVKVGEKVVGGETIIARYTKE